MPTITRFASEDDKAEKIVRSGSAITLLWDYYTGADVSDFKLYFREHGALLWKFLDTTTGSDAQFTVQFASVGSGNWDFGVSAVDSFGNESDIHSSLDQTAIPVTGWYLNWQES